MSQPMEEDNGENIEIVLIQHMVRLLQRHQLNGPQAKNLLDKVRVLVDAQSSYKSHASFPDTLP
jgi:hypothetical protein